MKNEKLYGDFGEGLTDEQLSHLILKCAFKVHTELGPGLLESVYRTCLTYELKLAGLIVVEEYPVSVTYRELVFSQGFRLDILVENRYVLELKVTEKIMDKHEAQILSYMRFTNVKRGLILNFMENSLHPKGVRRIINSRYDLYS